jgi:hypothetical protein
MDNLATDVPGAADDEDTIHRRIRQELLSRM